MPHQSLFFCQVLSCLATLLRRQNLVAWNYPVTMQVFHGLLSFTVHVKPKVSLWRCQLSHIGDAHSGKLYCKTDSITENDLDPLVPSHGLKDWNGTFPPAVKMLFLWRWDMPFGGAHGGASGGEKGKGCAARVFHIWKLSSGSKSMLSALGILHPSLLFSHSPLLCFRSARLHSMVFALSWEAVNFCLEMGLPHITRLHPQLQSSVCKRLRRLEVRVWGGNHSVRSLHYGDLIPQ